MTLEDPWLAAALSDGRVALLNTEVAMRQRHHGRPSSASLPPRRVFQLPGGAAYCADLADQWLVAGSGQYCVQTQLGNAELIWLTTFQPWNLQFINCIHTLFSLVCMHMARSGCFSQHVWQLQLLCILFAVIPVPIPATQEPTSKSGPGTRSTKAP